MENAKYYDRHYTILCSCLSVICGCSVFIGVLRWQSRVWSLASRLITQRSCADSHQQRTCSLDSDQRQQIEVDIFNARNFALKEVSDGLHWHRLAEDILVTDNWYTAKSGELAHALFNALAPPHIHIFVVFAGVRLGAKEMEISAALWATWFGKKTLLFGLFLGGDFLKTSSATLK